MTKRTKNRSFLSRNVVPLLTFLALLAVLGVIYLGVFGFPGWATEIILQRLNQGDFVIAPELVKFHPLEGIVFRNLNVYRKGNVGPSALEAEEVIGKIDILAPLTGAQLLQEMIIRRGVYRPEMMKAEYRKPEPEEQELVVSIMLEDMYFQGTRLKKAYFTLRSLGVTIYVDDISAIVGEDSNRENMTGSASYDKDQRILDVSVQTTFDPRVVLPMVSTRKMDFAKVLINRFEFSDMPPRCSIDFRRLYAEGRRLSVSGKVWAQDCSYRGVDVLRFDAQTNLEFKDSESTVHVGPMLVVRPEGITSGQFTVHPEKGTVDFEAESAFKPRALAAAIGVFTNEAAGRVRLEGGSVITAKGTAGLEDPSLHDIDGRVRGRGIGLGNLLTDEYSFDLSIKGRTNTLSNFEGRLFDADFEAAVEVVSPADDSGAAWYTARFNTHNADFEQVAEMLGADPSQDYMGKFSTRLNLAGPVSTNHAELVEGNVYVKVRDGRIFLLPVFGDLSRQMAKIVPGIDFVLRQGDATAEFVVKDGKMHTDEVRVEGDVLSLKGKGDYHFNRDLDFTVQLTLMKSHPLVGKVLRMITWPISKLFEFRLKGSLDDPKWYPVNFSGELLERLGLNREQGPGEESAEGDTSANTDDSIDPDKTGREEGADEAAGESQGLHRKVLGKIGLGSIGKDEAEADEPVNTAEPGKSGGITSLPGGILKKVGLGKLVGGDEEQAEGSDDAGNEGVNEDDGEIDDTSALEEALGE